MNGLRPADCVLRAALAIALLGVGGCKAEDPPTPWEIVRGTAQLQASMSLTQVRDSVLANFPTRTGQLVVADDSTVSGWIRLAAGDTVHITAGVLLDDGGLVVDLPGLSPSEYAVITDGDFPDTYGLLSTSTISGGDHPSLHLVYWEFSR